MNAIERMAAVLAASAMVAAAGCGGNGAPDAGGEQTAAGDYERGAHNGRLLRDGSFGLEITIFEDGVPPEYRVYAYENDEPIAPGEVELTVELGRLGGRTDRFSFRPEGDYLRGDGVVAEPHSFDVRVTARRAGQSYRWDYPSYEGRVVIPAASAAEAGIVVEPAGPAAIHENLELTGTVRPNTARLSRVRARFPGMIREVRANLGETVSAGEVLAIVQSNESLENYSVTSPVAGTVLEHAAVAGEATGEEPMFVVGDLTKLWAELDVFGRDLARVKPGQPVRVLSLDEEVEASGTIASLSPVTTHASQSVRARVVLDNSAGQWRPGQFVHGVVTIAAAEVPLAVKSEALQAFRDFTVVFARVGETYEVRMLELGRSDGTMTEVLDGLDPGTEYVSGNSYLIKADIEKSGASHDH